MSFVVDLWKFVKVGELRQKSGTELKKILQQKRERLRTFRFNLASGKIKNVREISEIKKDIARILTILNETNVPIRKGVGEK